MISRSAEILISINEDVNKMYLTNIAKEIFDTKLKTLKMPGVSDHERLRFIDAKKSFSDTTVINAYSKIILKLFTMPDLKKITTFDDTSERNSYISKALKILSEIGLESSFINEAESANVKAASEKLTKPQLSMLTLQLLIYILLIFKNVTGAFKIALESDKYIKKSVK